MAAQVPSYIDSDIGARDPAWPMITGEQRLGGLCKLWQADRVSFLAQCILRLRPIDPALAAQELQQALSLGTLYACTLELVRNSCQGLPSAMPSMASASSTQVMAAGPFGGARGSYAGEVD